MLRVMNACQVSIVSFISSVSYRVSSVVHTSIQLFNARHTFYTVAVQVSWTYPAFPDVYIGVYGIECSEARVGHITEWGEAVHLFSKFLFNFFSLSQI